MLFGLSIGLVVALGVYVADRMPAGAEPLPRPESASAPEETETATAARESAAAPEVTEDDPATRFDFYEFLPEYEVIVPEVDAPVSQAVAMTPIEEPGLYMLQAGSFRSQGDADTQQANLAMLGIESNIHGVTIEAGTFHRVLIGPIADLSELNGIRRSLIDAEIDSLPIKLRE